MHLLCLAESEAQNLVKNFRIAARNARSAGFLKFFLFGSSCAVKISLHVDLFLRLSNECAYSNFLVLVFLFHMMFSFLCFSKICVLLK